MYVWAARKIRVHVCPSAASKAALFHLKNHVWDRCSGQYPIWRIAVVKGLQRGSAARRPGQEEVRKFDLELLRPRSEVFIVKQCPLSIVSVRFNHLCGKCAT